MKKAKAIHRARLRHSKRKRICYHDWERDGQTMLAVRWVCTRCKETKLMG